MSKVLRVGVMGCGNIAATYFKYAGMFRDFEITACADLNTSLAEVTAQKYNVMAATPKALLADKAIDIILNLTVPAAHYEVSLAAVQAGKHVYSEKPLTLTLKDGKKLAAAAAKKHVKVGGAPDTVLGGAPQLARQVIDQGLAGKITSGTAVIMSHGMEHWHPNPDFFFKPGGGPILDLGPYYTGELISLLGPVRRVAALSSSASKTRTITSSPRAGTKISVKTPTTIHAVLEFVSGATISLIASWDVWAHGHSLLELYGTEASLYLPDPNFFGGDVKLAKRDGAVEVLKPWDHPFSKPNETHDDGMKANYRSLGLADFAASILKKRDARCSLERVLHGVDVMTGILKSGETGRFVAMTTTCDRPQPLRPEDAKKLLR